MCHRYARLMNEIIIRYALLRRNEHVGFYGFVCKYFAASLATSLSRPFRPPDRRPFGLINIVSKNLPVLVGAHCVIIVLFFFLLFHARAYDTRLYRMRRTAIINKKKKIFLKNDRRVKRTASRPSRASRGRSEISTGWAVCRQRKTRANHGRALERIVRGTRTCPVLIFHPGETKADVTRKQGKHSRWERGRRPETQRSS